MPLAGTAIVAQEKEECTVCAADVIGPLMGQDQVEEDNVADLFGPDDPLPPAPIEQLPPVEEAPAEEVNPSKPKRHPGNPTKEELDKHNLTHVNYRSWCAICNRAALKEDPTLPPDGGRNQERHSLPQL